MTSMHELGRALRIDAARLTRSADQLQQAADAIGVLAAATGLVALTGRNAPLKPRKSAR